ncbi:MAG: hypothetical protein WDN47_02570 [Candidatus Doudnabacteria bacterium]
MKNHVLKIYAFAAILALFLVINPALAQGSLSLSQTNVFLNVGQNTTVTVFPPSGEIVNVTMISNTYVAYANVSNNVVTIYGLANGTSQIQLGTFDNYTATISVTVGDGNTNPNNGNGISLSQNNVSLNIGQSSSVSILNNNNSNFNSYYISNNSNNNVVSASISGNLINLFGQNSGSTTITVYSSQNPGIFATLFVTVGGGNSFGSLTFSQSSVSLNVGQSASVSIFGNNNSNFNSYFISSNSQSFVASASISNNLLTITGNSIGSTSIVVNSANNQSGTIFVTVGGGNNTGTISFSQNNVNLNTGQSASISIFNSNNSNFNTYFISNNSNGNVVTASVSGSTINLNGLNSGSSTITVYSSQNSANFATLFVTVGGGNGFGSLSFSQSNVSMNVGQNSSVSIFNNVSSITNTYYISNNSNSSVVNANISGSTINLYGQNPGSASITVYSSQNSSLFATLFVTVGGSNNFGNLSFSPNNVSMNVGQSTSVSIFNNINSVSNTYYISNNSNSSVVSASISGNTINLYGMNPGSTTITVYSTPNSTLNSSNSGTLFVTVGGSGSNGTISFSQNNVNLNIGQSTSISIFNNLNSSFNTYYISGNTNSNVVSASISGNTINLYGMNSGSTTITVYSSQNSSNLGTLYVIVGGYNNNSGTLYFSSLTPTQAVAGQYYNYQLQVLGGTSPYSFSLNSGSMAPGLLVASNGNIVGTPTIAGNYNFTVRASDYIGRSVISGTMYINVLNNFSYPGNVAGTSIYSNGTLLNDNGTIYIVYKNTKTGFGNLAAFRGLGFKLSNVIVGSDPSLINSGFIIGSANMAHPWGSWIKNGSTVYFVHDQGLIPISSHDVFINNGGRDNLVVAANAYDLTKPILDIMSNSDPRLR